MTLKNTYGINCKISNVFSIIIANHIIAGLLVISRWVDSLNTVQSQKAVSVYFISGQILPSDFAEQNTALQIQEAVTTYY